jgi:hypothetical protein
VSDDDEEREPPAIVAVLVLYLPLNLTTALRFLELYRERPAMLTIGRDAIDEPDGTIVLTMRAPS